MLAAPGATPAFGGSGLSPHSSGTGSGRTLPRVSRGDRSVRRRLSALVGKGKRDITELRPAKGNLGGEQGTSEGNLVALACSRDSNVASRSVLQRRPGHLRPPHSARPRRAGRGAGDSSEPRRLWRMVLDACPGDPEAMSRGKA